MWEKYHSLLVLAHPVCCSDIAVKNLAWQEVAIFGKTTGNF